MKKQSKSAYRDHTVLYVNGIRQEIFGDDNFLMLANWLRRERDLTGTKIVCAEGDCGACTIQQAFPAEAGVDGFQAVNSCIKLVCQMDGASIVTIEGIQNGEKLSPVQESMKSCHGSQCGYCTPGFVMAMSGVLENKKALTAKEAMNCLTGNLCRCTGYQPIIDAALTAKYSDKHSLKERYLTKEISTALKKSVKYGLLLKSANRDFYAPVTLNEALQFLNKNKSKNIRIISSSTDLGVQYNKGKPIPDVLLSLHLIPELQKITRNSQRVIVGARVSLTTVRDAIEATHPEFAGLLNIFASPQIKNTATLVGNVANASPIGDTPPFLMVANGIIHTASLKGTTVVRRKIPIKSFYRGYKTLALNANELITHVSFAMPAKDEMTRLYKVSSRKDLDISTVCGAFTLRLKAAKKANDLPTIADARIALGGVAATTIRCPETEDLLAGKPLTSETFHEAGIQLTQSIKPLDDLRGTAAYRQVLTKNMFERFGSEVIAEYSSREAKS